MTTTTPTKQDLADQLESQRRLTTKVFREVELLQERVQVLENMLDLVNMLFNPSSAKVPQPQVKLALSREHARLPGRDKRR